MLAPRIALLSPAKEGALDAAETNSEPLRSNGAPPAIEAELGVLRAQLRDLQLRVGQLEQRSSFTIAPAPPFVSPIAALPTAHLNLTGGVATFGRALLGIAGAYLLRALTELGVLNNTAGVAAGLAYAILWLWFSTRPRERTLSSAVYAFTSFLIMGPLLWEATSRFHAISTWTAAAVIGGVSVAAQAMLWRNRPDGARSGFIAGLAPLACALIALFLLLGDRDLLPFVSAMLLIAAGVEFAALYGAAPGTRWAVAGLVDLAFVSTAWVLTRGSALPEGYAPAPLDGVFTAQILLVSIYMASVLIDTVGRNSPFGVVRILQTAAALSLGLGGLYAVGRENTMVPVAAGIAALTGAAGFYAIAYSMGRGGTGPQSRERAHNATVYGWLGFALAVAASPLVLPAIWIVTLWTLLAVAAASAERFLGWSSLQLQESGYLLIASAVSGLWEASRAQLFTATPANFPGLATALLGIAAILCYLPLHRARETDSKRFSIALIAANWVWLMAGVGSHVIVSTWPSFGNGEKNIPATTIATAALICLSLLFAYLGVRWQRKELIWVVYGAMAVGAVKLAVMDFAYSATLPLVVSLLFYGGGLMLLPRILARKTA